MKKKEVLIVLVLAVLVTGVLAFLFPRDYCVECSEGFRPFMPCFQRKGWPLVFFSDRESKSGCVPEDIMIDLGPPPSIWEMFNLKIFLLDFLFWFLVLAMLWIVVKWVKGKVWKK